jgi:hypothetical protein
VTAPRWLDRSGQEACNAAGGGLAAIRSVTFGVVSGSLRARAVASLPAVVWTGKLLVNRRRRPLPLGSAFAGPLPVALALAPLADRASGETWALSAARAEHRRRWLVMAVPRGDAFDDDQVEGAVKLDVDQVLELGPVAVDELADASLDVNADQRGHATSVRRPVDHVWTTGAIWSGRSRTSAFVRQARL